MTPNNGSVRPVANPDDPPVRRPARTARGLRPAPYFPGLPGRGAIVEGQVFVVAFIFIAQLLIVTEALYELLSGRSRSLGWLALASLLGFIIAIVVWRWPRRSLEQ
ncbi:MAG: hypothetical protein H0X24_03360 [Ktedonobacterales bacterium]|nr:hypothetical protein [Ktedonobacterales bacterium]